MKELKPGGRALGRLGWVGLGWVGLGLVGLGGMEEANCKNLAKFLNRGRVSKKLASSTSRRFGKKLHNSFSIFDQHSWYK